MKIPVLGIACTQFGELWHHSLSDLLAQAQYEALKDANLAPKDIDMIFTANMGGELWNKQGHLGTLAADILGISVPAMRVEAACASGGVALAAGVMAIMSGAARTVMITGVEKMTDVDPAHITSGLMNACLHEAEPFVGASFASLFALVTRQYFLKYGIGREHLAAVSVKNHAHALLNPLAHLHKKITIDDVLRSSMVADPLSLLDCSPISDGAACIILGNQESPRGFPKGERLWEINKQAVPSCTSPEGRSIVNIIASAQATDSMTIASRPSLTTFAATRKAAAAAYAQAGIKPSDIDVVELHDAFTMAEIIALEDLGFYAPGRAANHAVQGGAGGNGPRPFQINPSGGLKAKGHPIGATGIAQAVEIVTQLRGDAAVRQVPSARIGLTQNMGGIGTTAAVHIFEREDSVR